ncbi:hypothetical protein [uncultured Clostridium sp.]|uniref:hypothetical protein n=1 Tax=uncultured Clostridium sp. TaxID=59620 RepID=UPI0028E40E31|nr:hypothetical protein [uncultured Clostridium sp.]
MFEVQRQCKTVDKKYRLLAQYDLNEDRERLLETIKEVKEELTKLEKIVASKEGKFKALTRCLECREDGIEYSPDTNEEQECKCHYCHMKANVRVYKNGNIRVKTIFEK